MKNVRSPYRTALCAVMVLVPLIAGCTSSKADPRKDEQTLVELALSALSVSRPDYGFNPAPTSGKTADGLVVTVTAYPLGAFMAESPGDIPVSVTFDHDSVVTHVSPLPETRLGRALKLLGTSNGSAESTRGVRELRSNMGRDVEVVAVAELAEPMTETAALKDEAGLTQPQRALLSPGGDGLPLGNSLYCDRTCDEQSYTASFQEWVSTLRPQDRPTLKAFGLDLDALRATSQRGRIHGLIYENYDVRTLLEISKNPRVKALYVAAINSK
ncbi:hypothetical protein AB0B56_06140 [Streptosporangium canum]|uniref:hypothetical protein n=1 Tax=Streptosporangium canum TaxID=324952 RepID=UPI003414A811